MSNLLQKLAFISDHYNEIGKQIVDPAVISDMKRYVKLSKEYKELEDIIRVYKKYKKVIEDIELSKEIMNTEKDDDLKDFAKAELELLEPEKNLLEEEIKMLLVPKDPEDSKNAIMEIRAGTGGDEASIFAGDLFRMYSKYADNMGWKIELVDTNYGSSGGYKEIIFNVEGKNAYGTLKFEAGVHRVQRVPQTETMGRVHTSAATIIVLPEAEEFDLEIKESDIRVDSFCSSGPGGQSVNTTYSAIRLTHLPSGVVAQCQDQKSKTKNYEKALSVLRTRILDIEHAKKMEEDSAKRKTMVTSGDRSAKIRTYNYSQGRVTDHRINLTLYNLQSIVNGDIHEIIDALRTAENAEKLKSTMDTSISA
jgi:peptide chain release factor 1